MIFQSGDAVQKSTLHFLKFYFNLGFFFADFIEYVLRHFRYFSNLKLDFEKIYFGTSAPNRIQLCVSEGRSQKLIIVTLTPQSPKSIVLTTYDSSIALLVISDLIY